METYQLQSALEPLPAKSLLMSGNTLLLTRTSIHEVGKGDTCGAMSVGKLPLNVPYQTTRVKVSLCLLTSPGYRVTRPLTLVKA